VSWICLLAASLVSLALTLLASSSGGRLEPAISRWCLSLKAPLAAISTLADALALAPAWIVTGLLSYPDRTPTGRRKPGDKLLVIVDVSSDYATPLRDLAFRLSKEGWIMAITRRGSPVAKILLGGSRVALAYLISGRPHPRDVGKWEFELAPSQPQILGVVSAAKESWESFTLIFDSLTDMCALVGCKKARNLAREIIGSLRSEDTLLMILVEGAHEPAEERMFIQLVGMENVVRLP